MYLSHLEIKNFRAIRTASINFHSGLNILIGENNAGKSTILDALRWCLDYGSEERQLSIRPSDFYHGPEADCQPAKQMEFHLTFELENKEEETVAFYDLLRLQANNKYCVELHAQIDLKSEDGLERVIARFWGGEHKGQSIEPETLRRFWAVYLGALRDAERDLRPIKGSHLAQVYQQLIRQKCPEDVELSEFHKTLINPIMEQLESGIWADLFSKGKEAINGELAKTTFYKRRHEIHISPLAPKLERILENLSLQIPVAGLEQVNLDLDQNGLGYNNLIYMACVLSELSDRKKLQHDAYFALLIEEPEAHLHPQLQNLFFDYLQTMEPNCQIFVSSHSPTITAKANLTSLHVLHHGPEGNSMVFSPRSSNIEEKSLKYLKKFLDVTKSQLLFSQGVILVEGISEALLFPLFARQLDLVGLAYDLNKNGVELVNVSGVAFEHFAALFANDTHPYRLQLPCAIVTDDDRGKGRRDVLMTEAGSLPPFTSTDAPSDRANSVLALAATSKFLHACLATYTFEHELFSLKENREILFLALNSLLPQAGPAFKKMASAVPDEVEAQYQLGINFVDRIKDTKSEFALTLASLLDEDSALLAAFKVPEYIQHAIRWAVTHNSDPVSTSPPIVVGSAV